MTGKFITFEGGEGSGKSTQLGLLWEAFNAAHIPCLKTREPGGSPGAEQIRKLLVSGDVNAWDPMAETLLFYAARLDHVNTMIRPALAQGKTVICDRFSDSTMVYQGVGKNVSENSIQQMHKLSLGDFMPDLTLILDIDPALGLERAMKRVGDDVSAEALAKTETRFESMDIAFHEKVRAGFLAIAKKESKRCAVVDASQDPASVHKAIIALVNARLGVTLSPCQT